MNNVGIRMTFLPGLQALYVVLYFSHEIMCDPTYRCDFRAQAFDDDRDAALHLSPSLSQVVLSSSPKEMIRMSLCRLKPTCSAPVGME
jgi:hypothetical protein